MTILKYTLLNKGYPPMPGGIEEFVMNLHSEFRDEMEVFCFEHPEFKFEKDIEGVVSFAPIYRKRNAFFSFSFVYHAVFKSTKTIIVNWPDPLSALCAIIKKLIIRDTTLITYFHAPLKYSIFRKLEQPLLRISDRIGVSSLLNVPSSINLLDDRIFVFPFKSNLSLVEKLNGSQTFEKRNRRQVVWWGRASDYKGLSILTKIAEGLESDGVVFTVGGDALIENYDWPQNVTLIPRWLKESEVIELLDQSSLMVFPSIDEAEAFGIAQLDALARRTPVVTSFLRSGVPEVVGFGRAGAICRPGDVEDFKRNILLLLNDQFIYNSACIEAEKISEYYGATNFKSRAREFLNAE